jgi:hypothetical protein
MSRPFGRSGKRLVMTVGGLAGWVSLARVRIFGQTWDVVVLKSLDDPMWPEDDRILGVEYPPGDFIHLPSPASRATHLVQENSPRR